METTETLEAPQPETIEAVEPSIDQQVETSTETSTPEEPVEEQAQEQELVEVEYEGKTYKLPPELKSALLRQADYTRKTQEVAELRRAVEAEKQALQQSQQLLQQNLNDIVLLAQLDAQLQAFDRVDWAEIARQDPAQSQQALISYQKLKEQRDSLYQQITQRNTITYMQSQQMLAQKLQEEEAKLAKTIPNWSAQTKMELREFGKSMGFNEEELNSVYDHRLVKLLYYAKVGYNAMQKAKAGTTNVKPTTTVKQSPTNPKPPEKMSMEEFIKWRQNQLRKGG